MTAPREKTVKRSERLARSIARRYVVCGVISGGLIFVYLSFVLPGGRLDAPPKGPIEETVFASCAVPVMYWAIRRHALGALRWIDARRAPTPDERDATLRLPFTLSAVAIVLWILVAAIVFLYNDIVGTTGTSDHILNEGAIVLAGLVMATATYLMVERSLRPLFELALGRVAADQQVTLRLRSRILLAWGFGTGIPVLGIAYAYLGRTATEREAMSTAVVFLAIATFIGGGVTMLLVAQATVEPLDRLRHALREVGEGQLAAAVPVDDGGEIGFLEAGFNGMVDGLRERRQLQDLFGRHVGIEVARQALARSLEWRGEEHDASVLFVDVIGSTALAASRHPAEVVEMLNTFFACVHETVAEEGGWVNKFAGDGAMCVFGVPTEQPEHAEHALRAARALRERIVELGRRSGLDAAIGVSSGRVVAGNVGASERYEFTVIGDPVNEASRLTEQAKHHDERVLASGGVVERTGAERAHWREVGGVVLRGRVEETRLNVPAAGPS